VTIVAAYRYGPFAIVLNDFRITHDYTPHSSQVKQIDACMKFAKIGSRIGIFFAGDVALIQKLIPLIRQVESQITITNVINSDGILRQTLLKYIQGLSKSPRMVFQAIGIIIDQKAGCNEVFQLEGVSGTDTLRMCKLPSGKCTIIGDGVKVPNLDKYLTNVGRYWSTYKKLSARRRYRSIRNYKFDQQTVAKRDCGSAVYRRLGISPHFAVSLIGRGSFIMQGGTTTEKHFTTDFIGTTPTPPSFIEYSMKRDPQTHSIVLTDHKTNQQVTVEEIERYREKIDDIIFDTQDTAVKFDLSAFEASGDALYVMNQWVDDGFVERCIDKCVLLEDGFYCPEYIRLASDILEPIPGGQLGRYMRSGKHVLYISNTISGEFEQSIKDHVFDHEWLEQYIQNYSDYFV